MANELGQYYQAKLKTIFLLSIYPLITFIYIRLLERINPIVKQDVCLSVLYYSHVDRYIDSIFVSHEGSMAQVIKIGVKIMIFI